MQQQGGSHSQDGMHLCNFGEKKEKTLEVKVKRLFMKKKKRKTVSLLKNLVQVKKTHNVHIMFYSKTITGKHNYPSEMIPKKGIKTFKAS